MGSRLARFLVVLGLLFAAGCPEKSPVVERKSGSEPSAGTAARIIFYLPGDDIGGPEYREILDALQAGIRSSGAGEILSFGYGMGTMELVVANVGVESEATIRRIIGEVYPKARYAIERRPP